MENKNQELLAFLEANPKSNKDSIKAATSLGGLFLYTTMKTLIGQQKITEHADGEEKTYSLGPVKHEGIAPEHVKKEARPKSTGRDNSKFSFQDNEYGKGRLVQAVVKAHVAANPNVTLEELETAFPPQLMPRFGKLRTEAAAKEIAPKGKRYFEKDNDKICLIDCHIVICNQHTLSTTQAFIATATELGYEIS